jgi:hypothetical protein
VARSKRGKNRARNQGQSPAPDDARSVAIAEPPVPDEGGDSGLGALAAASEPVADTALGGSDAAEADLDDSKLDLARLVAVAKRESARPGADAASERPASADALASGGFASITSVASAAAPIARPRPTWVMPMLLGLGLGVGLAGLLFGLNTRASEPKTPAPRVTASAGAIDSVPAQVPPPVQPVEPAATTAAAPASIPAAQAAEPGPAVAKAASGHAAAQLPSTARPVTAPRAPEAKEAKAAPAGSAPATAKTAASAQAPAEAPAKDDAASQAAAAKTAPRSVDELLDQALAPEAQRNLLQEKQAVALAEAQLPATPSRDDVTKAMTVLLPAIRGCAMGHSGLANAVIVVRNDGQVASVEIGNAPFAGTASGRCMEGVMRRAQFPRFSQPIFRVKFPFAIQ